MAWIRRRSVSIGEHKEETNVGCQEEEADDAFKPVSGGNCQVTVLKITKHVFTLCTSIFRLDAPRFPMNIRKIRRIDRWVGTPLCFGFTLLRACFTARPEAGPIRSLVLSSSPNRARQCWPAWPCVKPWSASVATVFMIVFDEATKRESACGRRACFHIRS